MNPILKAAQFANEAHKGQTRKFSHQPYIRHPARVVARVALHSDATEEMVIAAWLHDVHEDWGVTLETISQEFGDLVARLVSELTNPSKNSSAPRAEKKSLDRQHLAQVSREAKIIKLIDRIDNLSDLQNADLDFRKRYCQESRLLVEAIGAVDHVLQSELLRLIEKHS